MDLSIVTTLYWSAPFIREFYDRTVSAAEKVVNDFEIIFVNDGSPDESLAIAISVAEADARVKVIDLSRNFGHHHAILAGLSHTCGQRIFLLDVDLEEQPECLKEFWDALLTQEADVVYGVQQARGGSAFRKLSGAAFYKLFNAISEMSIPENLCTIRLMNRPYLDAVLELREVNIFLGGLCAWVGFLQVPLPVDKRVRATGSTYNLFRLIRLFVNAITSFSSYPLRLVFGVGVAITAFSMLTGTYLIVRKLLNPNEIALGYASLMVSMWFLGGLIISFLGIIGLYLSGIYMETKRRPQFLVRKIYSQVNKFRAPQMAIPVGSEKDIQ
jgi:putative glycosyltransferase